MQQPQWDDEMKFELFRFRSELKTENIRVLAEPLGLGLLRMESPQGRSLYPQLAHKPMSSDQPALPFAAARPVVTAPTPPSYPPLAEMPAAALSRDSKGVRPTLAPDNPVQQKISRPSRSGGGWIFLILAHCVDLGFVGLCLGLGLIVLNMVIDPANISFHPHDLSQVASMQLVKRLSGWAMLAGVYVVFSCYWLFFKIVSGATLGETCLHNFNHHADQSRPLAGKGSGDS